MITIHRFHPFDGFARVTWLFHPDRIVIHTRSLTLDAHREIPYRKIFRIYRYRGVDFGWINRACTLIMWAGLGLLFYQLLDLQIQAFWLLEKVLVIMAILMALPGFRKSEYVDFLDRGEETLGILQLQRRSLGSEEAAIDLICRKNQIEEHSFADKLPKRRPKHTIEQLTPLRYWDLLRILFYEDQIIVRSKSLIYESILHDNYRSLSGKVTTGWYGDTSWQFVWCYWLYFVAAIGFVSILFFPQFLYQNWIFIWSLIAGFALLIPLYLLKFWKQEYWILLDRDGGRAVSVRVTKSNRDNLRKIERFVAKKVKSKPRKPA